jgi:hypothetical protein
MDIPSQGSFKPMTLNLLRLPALLAAFFAVLVAIPASAKDLILDAASGYLVDAQINGVPVRLRVDPETSGFIILNGEAAKRIKLRRSMLGAQAVIGPVRVKGNTKVARVSIGGVTGRRRLVFTDRVAAPGADGLIGPADMPFDRVTFQLRAPQAGERTTAIPMQWERSFGLFHPVTFGGQAVRFRFSTIRPDSIATAAAGAVIAAGHAGAWSGPPGEQMIKYEVVRPVRPMSLARPASFGGLPLDRFHVRTSDSRGANVLPTDPAADPDEIVVTGDRQRQKARYDLSLGTNWLSACSSLSWDNRTKLMTLSCRTAA